MDGLRIKLVLLALGAAILAAFAGSLVAYATYVPVWLAFVLCLALGLAGFAKYRTETLAARKRAEAARQAEEAAAVAARQEADARMAQQDAELKADQDKRALQRIVGQLLDFAEDLGAGASKDRVVTVMSESVAKLEPLGAYLALPEQLRALEDVRLVLSRLDEAGLSNTVTATRLRRLTASVGAS